MNSDGDLKERLQRDMRKFSGLRDIVIVLIVVMTLWMYTHINTYQIVHLNLYLSTFS